ncbi:cytochrome c [Methylobacterium sp. M6A4_1b]
MTYRPLAAALAASGLLAGPWAGLPAAAAPRSYDLPEPTTQLRPASGHEAGLAAAEANCQSCHSVDYIAMQPPGKGAAFWTSEVTKMRKVYHAPISEADGKAIAEYLAAAY